ESKSRTITAKKWISLPDRGLVFTIMAAARANIGWISCSLSLVTQFQATGMMTSVYSLLPGGSTAQTLNVTGRKLISADTTFTIADFATAKGSGGYGNCRASQAAFTSGHSARKKANRITTVRKSPRQSKQWPKPDCEPSLIPALRE